jgi:response regulator NasT
MAVRALIGEDERLIALALRAGMESQGYDVVGICGTGEEVCETYGALAPAVVLMDVRMPDLDGIEATRRLMEQGPAFVVIVSGSREPSQVERAERAGAMDYVVKPLQAHQIRPVLERAGRRFQRFREVWKQARIPADALEAWATVRQAVRALMDRQGLTEEAAHDAIAARAAQGRLSLHAAAGDTLAALASADASA